MRDLNLAARLGTRVISRKQRNGIIGVALAGFVLAVSAIGGSGSAEAGADGDLAEGSFELFEGGTGDRRRSSWPTRLD